MRNSLTSVNEPMVVRQPSSPERADEHKVTVRFCAGHECQNSITTHRVRQNVHGHREYCSLVCYSRWSPAMRTVVAHFPDYEQSPSGLESLIMDLKKENGIVGAAGILGISRSTVSYWLRKLQCFRQFAGQPPEVILRILYDVAEEQDTVAAASLIAVDPKTLLRAFSEMGIGEHSEDLQLAS